MYEHKTRYLYMPDRCLQGHLEQRQWVSICVGPQSFRHVFIAYDSYTHQKPIIDPMLYLLSSFTSMVFIYEFINSLKIIFKYPIICKKQKKKKNPNHYSRQRIIFIPMYLFLYTLCFSVTCQFSVYHWATAGDSYYMLLFNNTLDTLKKNHRKDTRF